MVRTSLFAIPILVAGSLFANGADGRVDVLVFSKTAGDRHDAIPEGTRAIEALAAERGWSVVSTEDASIFTDAGLEPFDVVVFLNTSGDVLDQLQEAAFERFIDAGHGFVGVHGAAETESANPWYRRLVGATATSHPDVQPATIRVEDQLHPSTTDLGLTWEHRDAYYNFERNPRAGVNVILSVDETSYNPGESFMGDHPIAWYRQVGGGRAFYTGLGHTEDSYRDELFLEHLAGAIYWAAGR